MTKTNVSEEMQAVIGKEFRHKTSFPVASSDIRKWAMAIYYPDAAPAVFWDDTAAAEGPNGTLTAPEDFNPFAWMTASGPESDDGSDSNNPDNTELILGIAGPGLKFQLNGGMEVEYGVPICPGDVVTSSSRISDYNEREGRLGLMLFTVIEEIWANQHQQEVRRGRLTLIRY